MRHHATVKSTRFNKRPKQNLSATNPHDSDTSKHFNQESKPNCNAKKQQASQAFVLVLKGMRSLFLQHVETCSNKHAKKKTAGPRISTQILSTFSRIQKKTVFVPQTNNLGIQEHHQYCTYRCHLKRDNQSPWEGLSNVLILTNPFPIPQFIYCLGREPSHVSAPVSTD